MIGISVSGMPDIQFFVALAIPPRTRCKVLDATRRIFKKDNSGCEHSNLDGPVGRDGNVEEFRCPICGNLVRRKLDAQGVPTTEIYIMGTAHSS